MKDNLSRSTVIFNPLSHVLSPKYEIMSENQKAEILRTYKIRPYNLPKILIADPAVKALGAQVGDIIRIIRSSETAGAAVSYRLVVSE